MRPDTDAIEDSIRLCCSASDHEGAATVIVEAYGREILGFLIARVRDPDMAGDIFSQFTEDLWRGLPAFQFRCSVRTWAYAIARHAASRHLKAARRERHRNVPLSKASRLSAIEQKVRTETLAAQRTETKHRIAQLREALPQDDQSLLILRVNRQLDWTEIAHVMLYQGEELEGEVLKREAGRLRKRFQLVKDRLRKMAKAEGLLEDDSG